MPLKVMGVIGRLHYHPSCACAFLYLCALALPRRWGWKAEFGTATPLITRLTLANFKAWGIHPPTQTRLGTGDRDPFLSSLYFELNHGRNRICRESPAGN